MSMCIGSATIVVVEHKRNAMHCDAFKGKLDAVLQMIDRGDLGGGLGYGCDEHKASLWRSKSNSPRRGRASPKWKPTTLLPLAWQYL
jgi:hypothetical protein